MTSSVIGVLFYKKLAFLYLCGIMYLPLNLINMEQRFKQIHLAPRTDYGMDVVSGIFSHGLAKAVFKF